MRRRTSFEAMAETEAAGFANMENLTDGNASVHASIVYVRVGKVGASHRVGPVGGCHVNEVIVLVDVLPMVSAGSVGWA